MKDEAEFERRRAALALAIASHGSTVITEAQGGERPDAATVVEAATKYHAWLEPDDELDAPPLLHPERAVLVGLYDIGRAMYESRASFSLIGVLEAVRDASIFGLVSVEVDVNPLLAPQVADLIDVLKWALNEAEPF